MHESDYFHLWEHGLKCVFFSVFAAIPGYHRLGGLNNRHLFPTALEAESPRLGWQPGQILVKGFFLIYIQQSSSCILNIVERGQMSKLSDVSSYKSTDSIMQVLHSWPNYFQRFYLLMPSYWDYGVNILIGMGGHRDASHNKTL